MFNITTQSMGQQVLLGQKSDIVDAISLAVEYATGHLRTSEHKRKEQYVSVNKVAATDTMAPEGAVVEIAAHFPTVARSTKSYWITQ